ncbi:MAG: glycoside hydrolase family 5 protein [Lachnospiraceae bacterium]|nr:glycoside hydrolase family 5 protein [Lachnospiraceae bacterium]
MMSRKNYKRTVVIFILMIAVMFSGCSFSDTASADSQEIKNDTEDTVVRETEVSSVEFAEKLGLGWNLGNTLEAYYDDRVFEDDLTTETCWDNPYTTKEMIDYIKEAGFTSVRIPVTWHLHLKDPDITSDSEIEINEEWMKRVSEVVDYCIDNDMYVIINIHHDNSEEYYYPDMEHREQSLKYVEGIWREVSEYFKDYDEHLIFEALNEPRLVGTVYEWKINYLIDECKEAEQIINESNQVFVDTVRKSGGNNKNRYLLVPGYDGGAIAIQSAGFKMPKDSASDKLLLEVHAYIPYTFALQKLNNVKTNSHFSKDEGSSTYEIDELSKMLNEDFIKKGIGVVVDEFGARNKEGNDGDRIEFYSYYIKTMASYGIPCFIWDNNIGEGDGEQFGIFDRENLDWHFKDVAKAIISAGKEGYGKD